MKCPPKPPKNRGNKLFQKSGVSCGCRRHTLCWGPEDASAENAELMREETPRGGSDVSETHLLWAVSGTPRHHCATMWSAHDGTEWNKVAGFYSFYPFWFIIHALRTVFNCKTLSEFTSQLQCPCSVSNRKVLSTMKTGQKRRRTSRGGSRMMQPFVVFNWEHPIIM